MSVCVCVCGGGGGGGARISSEPAYGKTYNFTRATSKHTVQPSHPRSLIAVFADRMCILPPPGYTKRNKHNPCSTGLVYRVICWPHKSYCR